MTQQVFLLVGLITERGEVVMQPGATHHDLNMLLAEGWRVRDISPHVSVAAGGEAFGRPFACVLVLENPA